MLFLGRDSAFTVEKEYHWILTFSEMLSWLKFIA